MASEKRRKEPLRLKINRGIVLLLLTGACIQYGHARRHRRPDMKSMGEKRRLITIGKTVLKFFQTNEILGFRALVSILM